MPQLFSHGFSWTRYNDAALASYHPPCLFLLSPSLVAIFFKETRQVLNCVLNQLLLMPVPGRDCTLLFKIGNISAF